MKALCNQELFRFGNCPISCKIHTHNPMRANSHFRSIGRAEVCKIQGSPFITLCLGSIELDRVISEPCYNRIIL